MYMLHASEKGLRTHIRKKESLQNVIDFHT